MKKSSPLRELVFDKIRRFWTIKPITKIKKSDKVYNRKKQKRIRKEDYNDHRNW